MINVKRISHATFETPDIDRQIDYFTQIAGLTLTERENGRRLEWDGVDIFEFDGPLIARKGVYSGSARPRVLGG